MAMGWKTILGGVLVCVGQGLETMQPPLNTVGHVLVGLGALFGAVGIAHKQTKILNEIKK